MKTKAPRLSNSISTKLVLLSKHLTIARLGLFLLLVGIASGVFLANSNQDLRQQAAYTNCGPGSISLCPEGTGAGANCDGGNGTCQPNDQGVCSCQSGPPPTATRFVSNTPHPTSTPPLGGNVCCLNSGTTSLYPTSESCTSDGGTVTSTTSCNISTPIPTAPFGTVCTPDTYRCVNDVEYQCIAPGTELSFGCGGRGCDGYRCRPFSQTINTCNANFGQCYIAQSCSRVYRQSVTGSCDTVDQVCCTESEHVVINPDQIQCISNTCANGSWCGNDGVLTSLSCSPGQLTCDVFVNGYCVTVPTATPIPTATPDNRCIVNGGYCYTSQSCARLNRANAPGICESVDQVCCAGALYLTPSPSQRAMNCLSNTCVNGKWCGSDGFPTNLSCTSGQRTCNAIVNNTCVTCEGSCYSSQSCSRLNRSVAPGSCNNVEQVCCGSALYSSPSPGQEAFTCLPNTCIQGKWCGNNGVMTQTNCNTGKECNGVSERQCILRDGIEFRCLDGFLTVDWSCPGLGCNESGGACYTSQSCGRLNRSNAPGSCSNVDQVCCAGALYLTPSPSQEVMNCLPNTCVNGKWCDMNGYISSYNCNNGVNCGDVLDGQCMVKNGTELRCVGGDFTIDWTCPGRSCGNQGGVCYSSQSCARLNRPNVSGSCNNVEQVCCGDPLYLSPAPSQQALNCLPNSCVNGRICSNDGNLTYLSCENYNEGELCRRNQDCGYGLVCMRDPADNSYACQTPTQTRSCYTFNYNTGRCESFLTFEGFSCPSNSSPNSDICINPSEIAFENVFCISSNQVDDGYCVGNNEITCNADGSTQINSCIAGCSESIDGCIDSDICLEGTSWCDADNPAILQTCDEGWFGSMRPEGSVCAYGCNISQNSCNLNPSELTYNDLYEQQLEEQYDLTITVAEAFPPELAYYFMLALEQTYQDLPTTFTQQTLNVEILHGDGDTGGYTYRDGTIYLNICYSEYACYHTVLHEIGHNTEEIIVESEYCPVDGVDELCTGIEGFVIAGQSDEHPIYFLADGTRDTTNSDINGLDSHSRDTVTEFYANYQAIYFDDPTVLQSAHPQIYDYFQDMYNHYDD